ncbi:MAG: hypothetical protein ISS79_01125 [Phycisphaerae bacterium]|nr:hypothetical protein [Phycisphaerae bacterium]
MATYITFDKVMDAADLHGAKLQRIRGQCRVFSKGRRLFCMRLYKGKVPVEFIERFIEWLENKD